MHIIRVFTHLQVRKILEKFILKRYTRDAREEVMWDRHDGVRIGAQASKEQCRMSKLLPKLMSPGRVGSKSDRAYEETNRQLDKITLALNYSREMQMMNHWTLPQQQMGQL